MGGRGAATDGGPGAAADPFWDGEVCAGVQSIFPFCLKPVAGAWGEDAGRDVVSFLDSF